MKLFKKIYVEITNICNKNCTFCKPTSRKKREMSLREVEIVLQKIKPFTNYLYLHVQGEPLLHTHFKEIIELCGRYEFQVNITTNGSLLEKHKNSLKHPCIRQINISLQSFEKKPSLDTFITLNTILEEIRLSHPVYIDYRFWALRDNQLTDCMNLFVKQLESFYKINHLLEEMKKEQNVEVTDHIYMNKDSLFEWPNIEHQKKINGFCLGLKSHIAILSDGSVVPCCLDADGQINLGNIFFQDLEEIIHSKKAIAIKKGFQQNKKVESLCQSCTFCIRKKNG